MDGHRWLELKRVVGEALEAAAADRPALLAAACGGDELLRAEAESLLAVEEASRALLEEPRLPAFGAEEGDNADATEIGAGGRIGRYEVVSLIARGGMGVVYRARQERPRREVALKVMRPGLMSACAARRFEHEAQLLARLEHPGIARMIEAGMHAGEGGASRPYLAMELVDGRTITEAAKGLVLAGRLELWAQACEAVEHAHQRGVVHRDLKPANILVDGSGRVRVLDFGVARATDSDIQATLGGDGSLLVGTIPYMSPEQAVGDPRAVDTRSDVYSLGVVGYEILAGRRPYAAGESRSLLESLCAIREEEPERPAHIDRALSGDIEAILLLALRKEPGERYQSAGALAADIRRHLRGEQVIARRPTAAYMLRVLARRHRGAVTATAAALMMLVAGAMTTAWQASRARRSESAALRQRDEFRNLTLEAIKQLGAATGTMVGTMEVKRRMIVAELACLNRLASHSGDDPRMAIELAEAYAKIAGIQGNLQEASEGDLDGAVENIGRALRLLEGPGVEASDVDRVQDLRASMYFRAGMILMGANRCGEAAARFGDSAAAGAERALTHLDDLELWAKAADPLMWQVRALMRAGEEGVARETLRDLTDWAALSPEPWSDWDRYHAGAIQLTLGIAHMEVGDHAGAVYHFDEMEGLLDSMESRREPLNFTLTRGDCDRYKARALERLGLGALAVDGYRDALGWYRLALELEPNARATNHIVWFTRMLLAEALAAIGEYAEANAAAAESVAAAERYASADPGSDSSLIRLAGAVLAQGQLLTRNAEAAADMWERLDLAMRGRAALERALYLSRSVRAKAMIGALGGATEETILDALRRNEVARAGSVIDSP